MHAVRRASPAADVVVVAAPPGATEGVADLLAPHVGAAGLLVVDGGATRRESVRRALRVVPDDVGVVLVHDAARALAPTSLAAEVVTAVRAGADAVVPGLPVHDTVKAVDDAGLVLGTVDRSTLRAVQTPQGFRRDVLVSAHATAGPGDVTDDAGLVEAAGGVVRVVPGSEEAFKVTRPLDLLLAGAVVSRQAGAAAPDALPRVGTALDVHPFSDDADRPCRVAGLLWPAERALAGHSDGDVVAHAAADALLAAAGLGDLGGLVGVDDPRWAGSPGVAVLAAAVQHLRARGWRVGNVSVQVVGQRPRLAERREEAQEVLSSAAGAPVSLSATTTDHLGALGREEGVAALATALVARA